MTTLAIALYLIGILLILSIFEVAEDHSPIGLTLLAVFWPIVTLHIVIMDLFFTEKE